VVRTLVSAGELSPSCARLLAGWVTALWLSRPLSDAGQPCLHAVFTIYDISSTAEGFSLCMFVCGQDNFKKIVEF